VIFVTQLFFGDTQTSLQNIIEFKHAIDMADVMQRILFMAARILGPMLIAKLMRSRKADQQNDNPKR